MSDEAVAIKIFSNETDATMAQQMLQQSGVRAFIFRDDAGSIDVSHATSPAAQPNSHSSV